jgi:hypothetical protein
LLYGLPFSSQIIYAQTDYQLDPKGHTDIGAYVSNYSGFHSIAWDASAVLCTGTGAIPAGSPAGTAAVAKSTSKVLPLVAGQVFSAGGCGSGYTPIVYGAPGASAGLPITGAYVTTGAGAFAPHETYLGSTVVGNYGQLRIVLEGTDRLGIDPTTGSKYIGNMSGFFQADYGAYLATPGAHGKYGLELGGFAAGFNGLGPGFIYYTGPSIFSQFSTDPSDYYFLYAGIKKFVTDTAYVGIWYVNMGLLPNTVVPAGSAQCPGCAITGDTRNALFGELNLAF